MYEIMTKAEFMSLFRAVKRARLTVDDPMVSIEQIIISCEDDGNGNKAYKVDMRLYTNGNVSRYEPDKKVA